MTDPETPESEPDWYELEDAYGRAGAAPLFISWLTSSEKWQRQEAVNDFLYSRAYHQYDVYSVTPWAIRKVLPLLGDIRATELEIHRDKTLYDELIHFCRICGDANAKSASLAQEIRSALLEGLPFFIGPIKSSKKMTVSDAAWLVNFCRDEKEPPTEV